MRRRTLILGSAAALLGWGWASQSGAAARPVVTRPTPAATGQPHRATVNAVIAFAESQSGKPYLWGGTGPGSFDCSGLVMEAYAHAGIPIPRTAAEQWAAGPQVSSPEPGDLVFFPGADGSWAQPGHVGLVTGPQQMIQAYAPGTPIGSYPYDANGALPGTGPGTVIGWTRPWQKGSRP
jgi:cell wall-associated NlpC family hydrolase